MEVVEAVLTWEPLLHLARQASRGGPLQVTRALRVCEALVEATDGGLCDPRTSARAARTLELVADGQDEAGVALAMEVVDDVLLIEGVVGLALRARQGGPLAVTRALQVCEALVTAADPAEGDASERRVG